MGVFVWLGVRGWHDEAIPPRDETRTSEDNETPAGTTASGAAPGASERSEGANGAAGVPAGGEEDERGGTRPGAGWCVAAMRRACGAIPTGIAEGLIMPLQKALLAPKVVSSFV